MSVVLAVASLACRTPAPSDVPALEDDEERRTVADITWAGVESLPESALLAQIRTQEPGWNPFARKPRYREAITESDVARIEQVYKQNGYFGAKAALEVRPDGRRVHVRFTVEEGAPVRVARRDIRFEPPYDGDRESLLAELPCAEGAVLRVADYRRAKEELLRRLGERGRPAAELSGGASVDVEVNEATIEWVVDPGPPVRVGSVSIVGLEHTEEALVRSELEFREGDELLPSRLDKSRENLLGLDVFRSAVLRAQRDDAIANPDGTVTWPVEVKLRERPPRTVTVGVGYGTEERVRGRFGWQHRNLLGGARTVGFDARGSSLGGLARAWVRWPRFFDRKATGTVALRAEREDLPSYEADVVALELEAERSLGEIWRGRIGHAVEYARTREVSSDADALVDDPTGNTTLSLLKAGLDRITVDDRLQPTRGSRLAFSHELSLGPLGSEVNYWKGKLRARAYRELFGLVLAGRLELGVIQPFAGDQEEDVPLRQRLFAGGGDSVRGYQLQAVGPRDSSDEPVGGTTQVIGSLELRFPIFRALGGVVFLDGGQVDLDPFHVEPSEALYSTGAGIRFATPIGPLRLDAGFPLNRREGDPSSRIHLSVGHAF